MDDIEFYTKLADSITNFKQDWGKSPKLDLNTAIRIYSSSVGKPKSTDADYSFTKYFTPDPFLRTLHQHAMPKWKRAVAELVKAVS